MNKVILIGRLTKEPKVGSTESGVSTAQFTIAVNRNYKNKDGNYEADFINCKAFRNTADFIGKYTKKGNQISLVGSLQTRKYDKNGETIYITEVLTESIDLLEKKQQENVPQNAKTEYSEDNDVRLTDEDLPF